MQFETGQLVRFKKDLKLYISFGKFISVKADDFAIVVGQSENKQLNNCCSILVQKSLTYHDIHCHNVLPL